MKGKIIVIEGNDCSGKETQTQLLLQRLLRENKKVERFDFPDYQSPTGKIVGGPFLGKKEISESYFEETSTKVDPKVASLYYAADRRYALPKIKKLLDDGYYVILDRYVDSNMAHQGCKVSDEKEREKLYQWFETLEYDLLELPKPDLTILLHMPLKKVLELKKGRLYTDDNESSISYLKISEEAYLEIAKRNNHQVIECLENNKLRDILDIHEEIYNIVIKEV